MKVIINNSEYNINYVGDRDDKYLVVVDDINKIKYSVNTWKEGFIKYDIDTLINSIARELLGINFLESYKTEGIVRKICHNDDFYQHYKKSYKFINFTESNLRY